MPLHLHAGRLSQSKIQHEAGSKLCLFLSPNRLTFLISMSTHFIQVVETANFAFAVLTIACYLLHAGLLFGLIFDSEAGGDMFLRNVG
jgi:hypothetical protein